MRGGAGSGFDSLGAQCSPQPHVLTSLEALNPSFWAFMKLQYTGKIHWITGKGWNSISSPSPPQSPVGLKVSASNHKPGSPGNQLHLKEAKATSLT